MEKVLDWLQTTGLEIGLIILITWVSMRISGAIVGFMVNRATSRQHYETERDQRLRRQTLSSLITASVKVAIFISAVVVILTRLGVDVAAVLAGAGVIGLVLGFGMQSLIKDWVAGAFIIMENQYRVGDIVEISGLSGTVTKITNRITVLRDASGSVHYIPNGTIATATNMTMEFGKVNLRINVAYESDIDKVRKVVDSVGLKLSKDKRWKEDIIDPPKFTRVADFGEYALVVMVVGKVKPAKQWAVEGELRQRLKMEFDKNGIVIPLSPLAAKPKP